MTYTIPRTAKGWLQVTAELRDELDLWNVHDWRIEGAPRGRQWGSTHVVTLTFLHPSGREIVLRSSTQNEAKDNLRVLVFGVNAMRLNEKRGLAEMMQQAYAQLVAPKTQRDPFELLGVRPDADIEVIEAAHRSLAKRAHPDAGGSSERMAELNAAMDRIREERRS